MSAGRKTTDERLGDLMRRLASSYDGEIVGTVKAMKRVMETAGIGFHDLATRVEKPNGNSELKEAEMKKIYDAGFNAGVKQVENQIHGDRAFRELSNVGLSRSAQMANYCWERRERLGGRDRGFVEGMVVVTGNEEEPSPKQVAWLIGIYRRLGGR